MHLNPVIITSLEDPIPRLPPQFSNRLNLYFQPIFIRYSYVPGIVLSTGDTVEHKTSTFSVHWHLTA